MNLLQVQNASKSFASKTLFENASFSVNGGEHIGVIGPNGAGKTSLFKALVGELELDAGEIIRSRELRIGYLRQHDTWDDQQSVEEFLAADSRMPLWDLRKLGLGLGLSDERFSAPIHSLSGGYRMRVKLLHLLAQEPNLMMLDEPTNYLDLETLLVLERFLQDFQGAFLLISHDREFLRRTTDHILEIEAGDFVKFPGTIDDYFEEKALLREQIEKQALGQAARRKQILDFAARFGAKATKARQVQSRLKLLNKMESIELKPLPLAAKIRIPPPTPTGRIAFEIRDADMGYGDKTILSKVEWLAEKGDRIGVVGYNGVGKSTFLKSIAREIPLLHGEVKEGYQVTSAFYAQHVSERLKPNDTIFQALDSAAFPMTRPQEILDLAGSLLFSGDDVKKKISVLSGGEKARVALGQILLKRAPLLILDEPTNHLDFFTVEALTQALETYTGTLIFVSHDRGFVRRVATKILEVRSGRLNSYLGTYDDYVWMVQQKQMRGDTEPEASTVETRRPPKDGEASSGVSVGDSAASTKSQATMAVSPIKITRSALPPEIRERLKQLEADKRNHDKRIQDLDKKVKVLTQRMEEQSQKLTTLSGADASQIAREMAAAQKKIQELENEILTAMEEKETATAEVERLKSTD